MEVPPSGSQRAIVRSCASAASDTSREQKITVCLAPAERQEATCSGVSPRGRYCAAFLTSWQ